MTPGLRAEVSAARIVPWTLVTALLVLLASAVIRLQQRSAREPYAPPSVSDPDQPVEALLGELDLDERSRLKLRITPLYADRERQALEAQALARRLELDPGEPWRVVRTFEGDEGERAAWTDSTPIRVSDDEGPALVSLPPAAPGTTLVDPLSVTLAAWSTADGRELSAVLWGRRPGAGARLEAPLSVPLEWGAVHRSEIEVPLARLDARETRNSARAQPSDGADATNPSPVR